MYNNNYILLKIKLTRVQIRSSKLKFYINFIIIVLKKYVNSCTQLTT